MFLQRLSKKFLKISIDVLCTKIISILVFFHFAPRKNSCALLIIFFLERTLFQTIRLVRPPIASTAPFPWEVAKNFHSIFRLKSFSEKQILDKVYLFFKLTCAAIWKYDRCFNIFRCLQDFFFLTQTPQIFYNYKRTSTVLKPCYTGKKGNLLMRPMRRLNFILRYQRKVFLSSFKILLLICLYKVVRLVSW